MYKNQLQELAQRSCFNLPSYASTREGPDHAPRFKASVNFNGEIFQSQYYSTTLRHAEHSAAEVALNSLSSRGPSKSLTARVIDETGVYKNLLQETTHRAGLELPVYTTVRSGPGHVPTFTSTVDIAGVSFDGEPAKTKKQAEKNAAITAWSSLKTMTNFGCLSKEMKQDQDQVIVAKVLSNLRQRNYQNRVIRRKNQYNQPRRRAMQNRVVVLPHNSNNQKFPVELDSTFRLQNNKSSFLSLLPPPPPRTISKILPPHLSMPQQAHRNNQEAMKKHWEENNEWISKLSEGIIKKGPVVEVNSPSSSNTTSLFLEKMMENVKTLNTSNNLAPIADQPLKNTWNEFSISSSQMGVERLCAPPQRIAQAVQIRSVIPVCATPPPLPSVRLIMPTLPSTSSTEPELSANLSNLKLQ